MVTRAKAKGGGVNKGGGRPRMSMLTTSEAGHPLAFTFEAASAAERKRKAEDSVDERLTTLTQTSKQLMAAQKEMTESQNVLMENNRTLMDTLKAQAEEIKTLKVMMADSVRQPSYSEAVAGRKAMHGEKGKESQAYSPRSPATKRNAPHVQDERAVSIDIGRYKGAKNNYAAVKENLQGSLKVNKVTERLTIKNVCGRDRVTGSMSCLATKMKPTKLSSTRVG